MCSRAALARLRPRSQIPISAILESEFFSFRFQSLVQLYKQIVGNTIGLSCATRLARLSLAGLHRVILSVPCPHFYVYKVCGRRFSSSMIALSTFSRFIVLVYPCLFG